MQPTSSLSVIDCMNGVSIDIPRVRTIVSIHRERYLMSFDYVVDVEHCIRDLMQTRTILAMLFKTLHGGTIAQDFYDYAIRKYWIPSFENLLKKWGQGRIPTDLEQTYCKTLHHFNVQQTIKWREKKTVILNGTLTPSFEYMSITYQFFRPDSLPTQSEL